MASARDAWIDEARSADLVAYARTLSPRLHRSTGEWTGPCPGCRGRDRFAISIAKNVWRCRGGGGDPIGGDVIALVRHVEGCDFFTACEILTGRPRPGAEPETEEQRTARRAARAAREAERERERAAQEAASARFREWERTKLWDLWEAAADLTAGDPATAYLARRGLTAPPGARLRCAFAHPYFAHGGQGAAVIHEGPALLAAIRGPDGRFAGLHATWIDLAQPDGKLVLADAATGEILPARKARGSVGGGRIELVRHPSPVRLVLGEGVETVLSAWRALSALRPDFVTGAAFWAGISLGNIAGRAADRIAHPTLTQTDSLGRVRRLSVGGSEPHPEPGPMIPLPASVTELWLCGDGDSDRFTTAHALERARRRYRAAHPDLAAHIAWAAEGQDFNDMLMGAAA
ncbi:DUF7146 domain-containing protein [Methylobacterium oryzihabitans]|uniref:DNA primase n=1 Tax=Methylobacterium oryzihabitans TaxID=2499852 RepID=A0A437NSZ4_9HYPH|nr:DNA primase [Methylobacterium oryzihabitans]RVU13145.1 DNA primase [Methylobacterium oryzihabitans]